MGVALVLCACSNDLNTFVDRLTMFCGYLGYGRVFVVESLLKARTTRDAAPGQRPSVFDEDSTSIRRRSPRIRQIINDPIQIIFANRLARTCT